MAIIINDIGIIVTALGIRKILLSVPMWQINQEMRYNDIFIIRIK